MLPLSVLPLKRHLLARYALTIASLVSAPVVQAGQPSSNDLAAPLKPASDLSVTLFAAEPLLSSPSNIDIDPAGRVWVCEVMNYRYRQNTRADGDRILVLEDTDGDGTADTQTVFYQGRDVDSALGICVIGNGPGRRAIVSCSPNVFILHDDNGDLVADRKEILFTKTGHSQHDHSVHAFSVGPDGWLYFNFGDRGISIHDSHGRLLHDQLGRPVNDSGNPYRKGMVFRCRPDGSDIEVLGHNFRNPYEVAVDSFGNLWQSDNDDDGNQGTRINWVLNYGNYGYVEERTGAGWQIPRTNLEAEVAPRHWHQNDPGVIPNLLLTGAGSPAGICVYEGTLLPAEYRGQLIHCDAGPHVVRAYRTEPAGAGYKATAATLLDGSADSWFRPSDVCVAPDGSLFVADWHDPGVGGHNMGDIEKGRIYRIAPTGSSWSVPGVDLDSIAGAVAALASPNLSTRATAIERLQKDPRAATSMLRQAFKSTSDVTVRARLGWALGTLTDEPTDTITMLAASDSADLRMVAMRLARLTKTSVIRLIEQFSNDPSAAVRREAVIALHQQNGPLADTLWAHLAARHRAGDRFETEAFGIGADGHWNSRLAAWRALVGDQWRSPAGREIAWRSRADATPSLICELLADETLGTAESLALVRGLDFQSRHAVQTAVAKLVPTYQGPPERLATVLPELLLRVGEKDRREPAIRQRADEAVGLLPQTAEAVRLIELFALTNRVNELIKMTASAHTDLGLATRACEATVRLAGTEPFLLWIQEHIRPDATRPQEERQDADRLLERVGRIEREDIQKLLTSFTLDSSAADSTRVAAIRGLACSAEGGRRLLELASNKSIPAALRPAAAIALSTSQWPEVRKAGEEILPPPKAPGGQPLPPLAELIQRNGDISAGKTVFTGVGTCSKCHMVGSEGIAVGPGLSSIGTKLSKEALYESILAPSAAISHNYETYTLLTEDGRVITGLLLSQTADTVVLKTAEGTTITTPTSAIDELVRQPISLMPADVATRLTPQQLVDLVAYLQTLRTSL